MQLDRKVVDGPGGHFGGATWAQALEEMVQRHRIDDVGAFRKALGYLSNIAAQENGVRYTSDEFSFRRTRSRDHLKKAGRAIASAERAIFTARKEVNEALELMGRFSAPASLIEEVLDIGTFPFNVTGHPSEYLSLLEFADDADGEVKVVCDRLLTLSRVELAPSKEGNVANIPMLKCLTVCRAFLTHENKAGKGKSLGWTFKKMQPEDVREASNPLTIPRGTARAVCDMLTYAGMHYTFAEIMSASQKVRSTWPPKLARKVRSGVHTSTAERHTLVEPSSR